MLIIQDHGHLNTMKGKKINKKEDKIYGFCKINNISYYKEIVKILEKSGFNNLNEKKIETYIRRIK